MKKIITVLAAAMLLSSCANSRGYWDATPKHIAFPDKDIYWYVTNRRDTSKYCGDEPHDA